MKIHSIPVADIVISTTRQRKEFTPEDIMSLASSISQNGLIQPVVIRRDLDDNMVLVAGERRLRAMDYIWNFGNTVRCGDRDFQENTVPCLFVGELDELAAFEMELEENVRRVDLTWQERSIATTKLHELRAAKARANNEPAPTHIETAADIRGTDPSSIDQTRKEILISKHLDDPDIGGAKTLNEAFKVAKRKEEHRKNEELAKEIGVNFNTSVHQLHQGNCIEVMGTFEASTFDVILSDPPYGMGAHEFGDSGGMATGEHFYDDSWTYWNKLMQEFLPLAFRVAKPQAHMYLFCDVDQFILLKQYVEAAGWKPFRTPIVWVNPGGSRAPWPEQGPQRKYQICLYAVKGDRPVTRIYPDVVTYPQDPNLGHPAQKPVALYRDLLVRSIRPGDMVLDPFMGSGPIIGAAHELKCKATGIEMDAAAFGIAVGRLREIENAPKKSDLMKGLV